MMFCHPCNRMTDEMTTPTICGFNSINRLLKDTTPSMPKLVHFIWLDGVYALGNPSWTVLEWIRVCTLTQDFPLTSHFSA